jgi:hypothetical protein
MRDEGIAFQVNMGNKSFLNVNAELKVDVT